MPRPSQSPISRRHNRSQQLEQSTPIRSHSVHNQDKLKVFIKFKPQQRRTDQNDQVTYINEQEIEIKTTLKHRIYKFDRVFGSKEGPREVFEEGCKALVDNVIRQTYEDSVSNNGLIFVYGNTGTGKTYSMGLLDLIQSPSTGLVPDALRYLFAILKRKSFEHYSVAVSFCEIYMDEIYDLLSLEPEAKLVVREDAKTKQPFLENQMTIQVQSVEQAFQIINIGLEKRRVAQQRMNRRSSRGHGLISINIDPNNGQRAGKLCFVDLAGCQRLKQSQSKGATLNEALHINSSLSSLQTLLMNISEQSIRNYRASKLTRMLQPYLQRGKIHLFVTSTRDSANTIQFAKRCKGIRFMEKDLRVPVTPARKSGVAEKNAGKLAKEVQDLALFKKQAQQRQKKYVECIQGLTRCLSRVSKQLQSCLNHQKVNTKFTFSEIINNADLEDAVNKKLQSYESRQKSMIEQLLDRLRTTIRPEEVIQNYLTVSNLSELVKTSQDYSHQIGQQLKGIAILNDYREIYKKQFFTSQLKVSLLQKRCRSFQQNLQQLTPYMNTNDKRVVRRLKQLGVFVDNNENHPHLRNKQFKRDKQSTKKIPLGSNHNRTESEIVQRKQQSPLQSSQREKSTRRDAIFIDELA